MKLLYPLFTAAIAAPVSAEVYFKEQFNDDVSLVRSGAAVPPAEVRGRAREGRRLIEIFGHVEIGVSTLGGAPWPLPSVIARGRRRCQLPVNRTTGYAEMPAYFARNYSGTFQNTVIDAPHHCIFGTAHYDRLGTPGGGALRAMPLQYPL